MIGTDMDTLAVKVNKLLEYEINLIRSIDLCSGWIHGFMIDFMS